MQSKEELFDMIRDPADYKMMKADNEIRAELVKIHEASERIEQLLSEGNITLDLSREQTATASIVECLDQIVTELDIITHRYDGDC